MIDIEQLKTITQLLDNLEIAANRLEKAYNGNNGEDFTRAKKEILDIQNKISGIIA